MKRLLLAPLLLTLLSGCSSILNSNRINFPTNKNDSLILNCTIKQVKFSSEQNYQKYKNSVIDNEQLSINKKYKVAVSLDKNTGESISFVIINTDSNSIILRNHNPDLFGYLLEVSIKKNDGNIIWYKKNLYPFEKYEHWLKGECRQVKKPFFNNKIEIRND